VPLLTTVSGSAMRMGDHAVEGREDKRAVANIAGLNRAPLSAEVQRGSKGLDAAGERIPSASRFALARQVCGQLPLLCALAFAQIAIHSRLSPAPPGLAAGYFGALIKTVFARIRQPPERQCCFGS